MGLPGAPLPTEDVPAPVRFLPEYDNLSLSNNNRATMIADEYRSNILQRLYPPVRVT
jgi:hypothetical protein